MATKVTAQPAIEPLTLTEVKTWLKIVSTADDSLLAMLLASTRQTIEDRLNLKLITQTVQQKLDRFPVGVELPLSIYPIQSVTSIVYKDSANTTQTLSADVYGVDTVSQPARIYLKDGKTWPTLSSEKDNITITLQAGFGDTTDDVPVKLKTLILHAVAFAYENRMNPIEQRRTYLDNLIYLHRNFIFE